MAYETVADIVTDAAQLLGIAAATISNPFASTDPNILQLVYILKAAGRQLVREHQWSQLQATHSFSTVAGTATYSMPADFDRHLDQTHWNTDAQLPLAGPATPQEWRALKVLNSTAGVQFAFRTNGSTLELYPTPTDAQDLVLDYLSAYWVQASGSGSRDKTKPTVATDTLWFDPPVLVHRVRRDWLRLKGYDSADASNAYEDALSAAKSSHRSAPVLSLAGTMRGPRMVGWWNLPPTGWGV